MSFRPLSSSNSLGQNLNEMNNMIRQLNKEQTTKIFKQASGNAIIEGKLPYDGGYGFLFYDSDGIANMVMGILPDGTMGIVIAKPGVDVLTVF